MNSEYEVIRQSNVTEVLKHFIQMEASRPKYTNRKKEMLEWITFPDAAFIKEVEKFKEGRCAEGEENPTFVWTIGTSKNKHYLKVSRWVLANVNLQCLYTQGINPAMRNEIEAVGGNLKRFVECGYARNYSEFQVSLNLPPEEARIFVGIAHHKHDRNGKIELIDGAHRVVAMMSGGLTSAKAYIAQSKTNMCDPKVRQAYHKAAVLLRKNRDTSQ